MFCLHVCVEGRHGGRPRRDRGCGAGSSFWKALKPGHWDRPFHPCISACPVKETLPWESSSPQPKQSTTQAEKSHRGLRAEGRAPENAGTRSISASTTGRKRALLCCHWSGMEGFHAVSLDSALKTGKTIFLMKESSGVLGRGE